jgi:large subunit ribosomal protein L27
MAHKKAASKNIQHVSPSGKRLGIKATDGQSVKPGMIILRQRGSDVKAGNGVKLGRDYTLYSISEGIVKFEKKQGKKRVSVI